MLSTDSEKLPVLSIADGIAGMASLQLYEAWLLGKPVLSLQPGVRLAELRMLEACEGVVFVDREEDFPRIRKWVSDMPTGTVLTPRPELRRHGQAAEKILELIDECLSRKERLT